MRPWGHLRGLRLYQVAFSRWLPYSAKAENPMLQFLCAQSLARLAFTSSIGIWFSRSDTASPTAQTHIVDQIQGLIHGRQILHHWAKFPARLVLSLCPLVSPFQILVLQVCASRPGSNSPCLLWLSGEADTHNFCTCDYCILSTSPVFYL